MDTIEIRTWEEIDELLRRLGELEGAIEGVQGQQDLSLQAIREEYREQLAALSTEHEEIKNAIQTFCDTRKRDLGGKRKKVLTYGKISYRVSSQLKVKDSDITLEAIRACGWPDGIRIAESVDKQALAARSDDDLARVGIERIVSDIWKIEPKKES